jgi:hypothetical protein
LLSLISSSINELLAGFLKLRARDLRHGIANMLCDPEIARHVLRHPLVKAMGSTRAETAIVQFAAGGDVGEVASRLRQILTWPWRAFKGTRAFVKARGDFAGSPSYVPARTFANALLDALDHGKPGIIQMDVVERKARDLASRAVSRSSRPPGSQGGPGYPLGGPPGRPTAWPDFDTALLGQRGNRAQRRGRARR